MKILFFSPHPYLNLSDPSGYGTHMRETIYAFRKLGHDVKIVVMGGDQPKTVDSVDSRKIKFAFFKSIIPSFIKESLNDLKLIQCNKYSKKKLEKVIISFKPDIIYERGYYLMDAGVLLAKKYQKKHILEINAPFIEEKKKMQGTSIFSALAISRKTKQLKQTDLLVVVSSILKEYFVRRRGVLEAKVIVLPNAVNPNEIKIDIYEVEKIKKKYQLDNKIVMGFVGSIFPYHGVDKLIQAFIDIYSRYQNKIKLMIVGDGETLPELIQLAEKSPVAEHIVFTGNVSHEQVYSYIQTFDIAVMAKSNWYGSPVKIFEYGALGKAIVAPDTIPVRDVMVNNQDGLLIKDTNKELTAALIQLIENSEERITLGNSFQKKVIARHTWEKNMLKILEKI